jgi:hypothetical protein
MSQAIAIQATQFFNQPAILIQVSGHASGQRRGAIAEDPFVGQIRLLSQK